MSGIAGWVMHVVQSLGYVGLAALVALENLVPPLPSELILPLAGFLTGRGELSFVGAVVAATVGSVVGALVLYGLGRWLGQERLRQWVRRRGKWLLLEERDLDKAIDWFARHGRKAVFFGRLLPGVRSFISIPAGIDRMGLWTFGLYTAVGSALWNTVLIGAGWALGHRWKQVEQYASIFEYVVLALIASALAVFVVKRIRAREMA